MGWVSTLGRRLTAGVESDDESFDEAFDGGELSMETTETVTNNPMYAIFASMLTPGLANARIAGPRDLHAAPNGFAADAFSNPQPRRKPLFSGEIRPTRTDSSEGFATLGEGANVGRGEVRT